MKKIFILMTACIALVFSLSGCSSQQTFTAREESFDAAGISSVVIDVEDREVSVGVSVGLTAKDGNISGTLAGGWDDFSISCETKKGECNLPESKPGGAKSLTVQCNNGDVNIAFSL